MALLTAAINVALDAVAGTITAVSLHTATPGGTGANEVSGSGYARQTPSFSAASSAAAGLAAPLTFSVPACTVTHVGVWAGSAFRGSQPLTASRTFGSPGTFTLDSLQLQGTST